MCMTSALALVEKNSPYSRNHKNPGADFPKFNPSASVMKTIWVPTILNNARMLRASSAMESIR